VFVNLRLAVAVGLYHASCANCSDVGIAVDLAEMGRERMARLDSLDFAVDLSVTEIAMRVMGFEQRTGRMNVYRVGAGCRWYGGLKLGTRLEGGQSEVVMRV
jgi:hypothetical protein